MASVGELRSVVMRARHVIDSQVLSLVMEAAQILHAERNVLLVSLDQTSRDDLKTALAAMGVIYDDLEGEMAETLSTIVSALDAYITYLGGRAGSGS